MPVVTPQKLASLQQDADNVRNICILAHVDHGKTSLTDCLLANNGIISPKMAGKVRYLDSRPDEQLRGITMESSAISLYFSMSRRPSPDSEPEPKEYLINLIDSPGHIDFSSEVSTASRLCDGAVVLVDAVEGVCSQTITVLRQTWVEKLKPLLVINKMDRLITELKMTPTEAFTHLNRLLEQVNAVLGSFFQGERMEEDLNWREKMEARVAAAAAAKDAELAEKPSEDGELRFEERDDEDLYFAPERNNVIFSSAIDGWAFTVRQFAALYEKKLGIKRNLMERVLWGNFYLDPKTKKVLGQKHLKGRNLKPMFVQLVLEPVWTAYQATTGGPLGKGDPALLEKVTKSLSITIPAHVLRSRDQRLLLTTVFSAWLPLSTALLVSVIESLPSPRAAQRDRLPHLLDNSPGASAIAREVRSAMVDFKTGKSDPIVVFVSKMVSVPASDLPENKRPAGRALTGEEARELARKKRAEIEKQRAAEAASAGPVVDDIYALATGIEDIVLPTADATKSDPDKEPEKEEEEEHLIGFARIYSGTLSVGDTLWALPPKHDPSHPNRGPRPVQVTVSSLYLLMGRSLESLSSVPAGVVFGIGGLAGSVLKSATLCSAPPESSPNLAGVNASATTAIVRVALEPVNPSDLDKMIHGLRLLVQSDPCAEYEHFSTGEHVLLTAGELHLERCLTDLRERFARCDVVAGEPIVPYRETVVRADEMRPPANKDLGRGVVVATPSSRAVEVRLRLRPLPEAATTTLVKNAATVKRLYAESSDKMAAEATAQQDGGGSAADAVDDRDLPEGRSLSPEEFKRQLQSDLESGGAVAKEAWKQATDNIVAFGPRRTGPNLLIDATKEGIFPKVFAPHGKGNDRGDDAEGGVLKPAHLCDKITYAFQLAMWQGPLCGEPVQGVAVFIEDVVIRNNASTSSTQASAQGQELPPQATRSEADGGEDTAQGSNNNAGTAATNTSRLTGEVIKSVQQGIRAAFLDWSPRMMLAMYSVEIQASTEVLGRVYDVLTRRRGRVLSEAMQEGTPFFTILSVIPVAESFGLADELRKRTSGNAQPQLVFAGFEVLDEDPFWVPFTEDDLEDLGELADRENMAKKYMDKVRARKGMMVEGRGVARDAEKQKTLKR